MEGRIKAGCTEELLRRHTHITDTLVVCAKAQASPRPSLGETRSNRKYTHRYQGINSLAMQQGLRERDRNMVFNLADPRGCPGSFLRRLFLRIGTDRPIEDDLAALHFDRDTLGI